MKFETGLLRRSPRTREGFRLRSCELVESVSFSGGSVLFSGIFTSCISVFDAMTATISFPA